MQSVLKDQHERLLVFLHLIAGLSEVNSMTEVAARGSIVGLGLNDQRYKLKYIFNGLLEG